MPSWLRRATHAARTGDVRRHVPKLADLLSAPRVWLLHFWLFLIVYPGINLAALSPFECQKSLGEGDDEERFLGGITHRVTVRADHPKAHRALLLTMSQRPHASRSGTTVTVAALCTDMF